MCTATGCSAQGVAALQWIHRAPGVRNRDLAGVLRISSPAAAQLLARLESKGLVLRTRENRDRRETTLRLSELGVRRVVQAERARAHLAQTLVDRLPFVLRPRLIRITERLLTALVDTPRTGLHVCRHCNWRVCREDPAAPCPVALRQAEHTGSSRTPYDPDAPLLYQDRRTVHGAQPPIELWLEPGHIAFRLTADRRLEVVCRAPGPGRIQVEKSPEGNLALYAWEHGAFTVLEAGREVFVQERPLSLDMGQGGSPRERVESLFGDFARRRAIPPRRWL